MTYFHSPISRLCSSAANFACDEQGGATVWNVSWLLVFAIMAGVAIDSSNGFRNKSMLQSTADVAALAGAMSLPNLELELPYDESGYPDVIASAEEYADMNMARTAAVAEDGEAVYGYYLDPDKNDIHVGHWDSQNRVFTAGGEPVNAVRVYHHMDEKDRGNGVSTTLLHMVGLAEWEVATVATAMRGIDSCLMNGIISREDLHVNGNGAEIQGDVCLHSQLKVAVTGGALWSNPKALSLGKHKPDVNSGDWTVNAKQRRLNPDGTPGEDVTAEMQVPNDERDLYPPMVDQIVEIGQSMLVGVVGYRHFSYPQTLELDEATPQPNVVVLPDGFAEVASTEPPEDEQQDEQQTWWRSTGDSVQVAGLDGFSHLAALLGLSSQASTTTELEYHRTYRYDDVEQKGNSANFNWPVNNGQITLDGVDWTADGAPTSDPGILTEETIYFADTCHSGKLRLTGHIKNITIVTNCDIDIAGTAVIENAVLLTSATGEQAVQISNGAQIGTSCEKWGNVRIYSNGDVNVVSGSTADSKFYGTQLVARDEIHFSAQTDMSKGVSLLSGGQTHITAGAKIGGIDSSSASQAGCPVVGGVEFEFDEFVQMTALVE